jgi:hypothetical protein
MKKTESLTWLNKMALVFLIGLHCGYEGLAAPRSEATLPPFITAPAVDGILKPGEWDVAIQSHGFQSIKPPNLLDPRLGKAWFGYTTERLYVAVASPLPPDGRLITTSLAREGHFYQDDSIEVWLDPNRDTRESAEGNRHLYQFVINATNDTLIRRVLPPGGVAPTAQREGDKPEADWKGGWTFIQTVDGKAGLWIFEASLPWSDLGWTPADVQGRSIGVLIARNYQRPMAQRTWFNQRETFSNCLDYPRLVLRPTTPYVKIETLGDSLLQGHLQLESKLINPGNACKATVWTKVSSPGRAPFQERKEIELPMQGDVPYTLDLDTTRLGEKGPHEIKMMVQQKDGNVTLLNWSLCWSPTNASGWVIP